MKIEKDKYQEWANKFADKEADDFLNSVPLGIEQSIILKTKLEAAVLYGMELTASLAIQGYDLTEAKDMRPALMRLASNNDSAQTR